MGRKKGMSKIATPKNRKAAKKIGGTAASNTTQRVTTIFKPQTKQTKNNNEKSLKPMLAPYAYSARDAALFIGGFTTMTFARYRTNCDDVENQKDVL